MADALLRLENGRALRQVARDIRQLENDGLIRRELRKELKGTADDIAQAEKSAVLRLPSKGQNARRGRPGLRRQVAKATQVRVRMAGARAGVNVWVNPKRMGPGRANLPGYMEGIRPFHRFRHPTFGDWDKPVQQRPTPWFYRTARPYEGRAEQAAERVIARYADRLERG